MGHIEEGSSVVRLQLPDWMFRFGLHPLLEACCEGGWGKGGLPQAFPSSH